MRTEARCRFSMCASLLSSKDHWDTFRAPFWFRSGNLPVVLANCRRTSQLSRYASRARAPRTRRRSSAARASPKSPIFPGACCGGGKKAAQVSATQERCVRWPVSRVLSTADADGWPFLWDAHCCAPRATHPDGDPETDHLPSLFGLAPGGACHATSVARDAVRSYRTISTLPPLSRVGGVIS